MTAGQTISVALVRRLRAPASDVYAAWTQPKLIARWLAPGAATVGAVTNDLRVGGSYRIDGIDSHGIDYAISGSYLDLQPDRRIELSWVYEGPAVALRGEASIVVAELRPLGPDMTELTVTHEKISRTRAADLNRKNWTSCLEKLGDAVDGTTPARAPAAEPSHAREDGFYRAGHRAWQETFETTRLADRLKDTNVKRIIGAADAAFIAHQNMFFLATVDGGGQPSCSYKGGARGFVKVIDEHTLAFPNYDGSGMYLSVGNLNENPKVALLFVDFERQARLRVIGTASARTDDRLLEVYPGAELIVRLKVNALFANCPRYIHKMELVEESSYVPGGEHDVPPAIWKSLADFADVLRDKDKHLAGDEIDDAAALNRD